MLSLALLFMASPPRLMLSGLPPHTIVLTYHDMVPVRDERALWFDCTPDELVDQLDWMQSQGASFISLDQLYEHLTRGTQLPPRPVAITFADNYLGFYRLALPILRSRRIPFAMFVHTNHVGSAKGRPKMNWDQLREIQFDGLGIVASQTKSHPPDLRRLSTEQLQLEFMDSKTVLERELGTDVHYLAYPNGKFDQRSDRAAEKAEYRMAFTEEQMPAEKSPGIYMVARYVHTRMRQAWQSVHKR